MKAQLETFDPAANYKARRPFILSGVSLNYDDPVDKTGIEIRRLKLMFEARMINIDPRPREEAKKAAPTKAAGKPASAKAAPKAPTPAPAAPAPQAGTQAPKAAIVNKGFGIGFNIEAPDGTVLKAGIKSKIGAEKELLKHL